MPRILARSAHIKDEIVGGDDRCRARCSIQDRQLAEGGTGCKDHETDVSAGLSQVRARDVGCFFVIRAAFVPPAETR